MILLCALLFILLVAGLLAGAGAIALLMMFGDVIVFVLIVACIIKRFIKKKGP